MLTTQQYLIGSLVLAVIATLLASIIFIQVHRDKQRLIRMKQQADKHEEL